MIRWSADARHRYIFRGSPATKRPTHPEAAKLHKEANKSQNLVEYLVQDFRGTGRNVTGDRFFTSMPTVIKLLQEYKLTYMGTIIMSNKRDIPPKLHCRKEVLETTFLFGGPDRQCTLAGYQATQKKNVLML